MVHFKKRPSLDISPGTGITPFEVGSGRFSLSNCRDIPWSLFCYAVLLFHLQASNQLFHKEMHISTHPFFNHRLSSTDLGKTKKQHVTLFCPSFFMVEKNLP